MLTPLLSLQDFSDLLETPAALELIRLRVHIVEAQRTWLQKQLAPWPGLYGALAAAVLAQQAPALPAPATLPAAPAQAGLAAPFAAIWGWAKPMLVYAAYASYLPFSKTTLTAHSVVFQGTGDNQRDAPDPTLFKQATIYAGWAQGYQQDLAKELVTLGSELAAYAPAASACTSAQDNSQGTVTWLPIRNRR